jgi:hypothetical protein
MYDDRVVSRGPVRGSSDDDNGQNRQRQRQRGDGMNVYRNQNQNQSTHTNRRRSGGHHQQPRQQQQSSSNRRRSGGGCITPGGGIMKQSSFSTMSSSGTTASLSSSSSTAKSSLTRASSTPSASSSSSWKSSVCKRTGEFCAAGHELLQIPTLDRQRYLQRKQLQQLQNSGEQPASISMIAASKATPATSIIIECDCCSKIISKIQGEYIAGCCLECDIDVCSHCFKNGQSYEDVVLKEWSRINDNDNNDTSTNGNDCNNNNELYNNNNNNNNNNNEQQMMVEHQQYHNNNNEQRPRRYNRRRPTYAGTGRVNYDDYPDPTVYQWSFTGSSSCGSSSSNDNDNHNDENYNYSYNTIEEETDIYPIEYFEKDFGNEIGIIQLDFYYTIGMIQTYLIHPYDGRIDLFTTTSTKKKLLSKDSYCKVLKDPRSYNNERYKKKQVL